jgi:hypothetical protein
MEATYSKQALPCAQSLALSLELFRGCSGEEQDDAEVLQGLPTPDVPDQHKLPFPTFGLQPTSEAAPLPDKPGWTPAEWTTLHVSNVPRRYSLRQVVTELEQIGLHGAIDFVYLQSGKKKSQNRGYCFINFVNKRLSLFGWSVLQSHTWTRPQRMQQQQQLKQFNNTDLVSPMTTDESVDAPAPAEVRWATIQGYEANLRSRMQAQWRIPTVMQRVWTSHSGFPCEWMLTADEVPR